MEKWEKIMEKIILEKKFAYKMAVILQFISVFVFINTITISFLMIIWYQIEIAIIVAIGFACATIILLLVEHKFWVFVENTIRFNEVIIFGRGDYISRDGRILHYDNQELFLTAVSLPCTCEPDYT